MQRLSKNYTPKPWELVTRTSAKWREEHKPLHDKQASFPDHCFETPVEGYPTTPLNEVATLTFRRKDLIKYYGYLIGICQLKFDRYELHTRKAFLEQISHDAFRADQLGETTVYAHLTELMVTIRTAIHLARGREILQLYSTQITPDITLSAVKLLMKVEKSLSNWFGIFDEHYQYFPSGYYYLAIGDVDKARSRKFEVFSRGKTEISTIWAKGDDDHYLEWEPSDGPM